MIKVKLMSLNNLAFNQKIFIRVELGSYKVESRNLDGKKSGEIRKIIDDAVKRDPNKPSPVFDHNIN
jgi:hypothetical protein